MKLHRGTAAAFKRAVRVTAVRIPRDLPAADYRANVGWESTDEGTRIRQKVAQRIVGVFFFFFWCSVGHWTLPGFSPWIVGVFVLAGSCT